MKVTDKEAPCTLTNTGSMDGAEVAQLYVSALSSEVFHPAKELKGFQKVFLKAGESKAANFPNYRMEYMVDYKDNKFENKQ